MIIREHRLFKKSYKKLPNQIKVKVKNILKIFKENPENSLLKNHKLHGKMQNKRSIYVTGDIRIIFEEFDNYTLVIMIDIGGHDKIYK